MGEYGAEPMGIQCWILCGGGCTLTCLTDAGFIILDAVGITMSASVDFDS